MQIKNKTVKNIIKGIENVKGENINIIDFSKLENVDFKYFVICDCQSNVQVNAISNSGHYIWLGESLVLYKLLKIDQELKFLQLLLCNDKIQAFFSLVLSKI